VGDAGTGAKATYGIAAYIVGVSGAPATDSSLLDPDPFGEEPPTLRRRLFGKREESRAARAAGVAGGLILLVLGSELHGFWGAVAVAVLLGAIPSSLERRARRRRRRESERLLPG
jgi:hypothetical protein